MKSMDQNLPNDTVDEFWHVVQPYLSGASFNTYMIFPKQYFYGHLRYINIVDISIFRKLLF
jgi:hypothetical protein